MLKIFYICFVMILPISLYAFGAKETHIELTDNIVAGLILDESGLGDDSVNDECTEGLNRAVYEGLVTLRIRSITEKSSVETLFSEYKSGGVDYIYLIGDHFRSDLVSLAKSNSDEYFIGLDMPLTTEIMPENSVVVNFREADGGYLAGVIAGSLTYRYHKKHEALNDVNRLGVILGANNPEMKRYELGFYSGVKEVNAPCEIITININSTDPEKAYDAAMELKEKGVDIIFSIAGEADKGVFRGAEESNLFVIGSHRDLNAESDMVLTSVVKNISEATYLITKELITSELFEGSSRTYGLNEAAITLAPFYKYDSFIPSELSGLIRAYTNKLVKNSEMIPDSIDLIEFDPEKVPEIVE